MYANKYILSDINYRDSPLESICSTPTHITVARMRIMRHSAYQDAGHANHGTSTNVVMRLGARVITCLRGVLEHPKLATALAALVYNILYI